MKEKEQIREELIDILNDKYGIKTDKSDSTYDLNLLGKAMNMGASDLLCFFLEVEKQYNITVSEEDIIQGSFKTINSIAELICEKSA